MDFHKVTFTMNGKTIEFFADCCGILTDQDLNRIQDQIDISFNELDSIVWHILAGDQFVRTEIHNVCSTGDNYIIKTKPLI